MNRQILGIKMNVRLLSGISAGSSIGIPECFFKVLNRLNDIDLEFDLILAGDTKHQKRMNLREPGNDLEIRLPILGM